MNWDEYFINMLQAVAAKSKDTSTKVGCIIVGEGKEIRSTGFNGFPRGIDEAIVYRNKRPQKYLWVEHAERNAIYNSARHGVSLVGCNLYVDKFPCADCARGIIQSGINRVVVTDLKLSGRWYESQDVAMQMFKEAKVNVEEIRIK